MNKIIIGSSDTAFAFQKLSGFVRTDELSEHSQYIDTYFLLHENDSKNVKDALKISHKYPKSIIYCILIDEQLGNKLKVTIQNFNYFIPSKLVSEKFVEAIKGATPTRKKFKKTKFKLRIDPWFKTTLKVCC
jgi:hypothetical protein